MVWAWVVILLALMFALGVAGAIAFQKPHAPDRRVGADRRKGDRRQRDRRAPVARQREIWTEERRAAFRIDHGLPTPSADDTEGWTPQRRAEFRAEHHLPTPEDEAEPLAAGQGLHQRPAGERRRGERRKGERRKKQPWWPKATVVTAAGLLSIIGVLAYAETQVPSIFNESNPALSGSGWADCETPVTWSLDTSRLSPSDAAIAVAQMTGDFAKWGQVSGLTFRYVGEVPAKYDDSTFVLSSDVHPSDRHIFVAFLNDSDSSMLDDRTVGIASPTKVFASDKEIVEGSVVLQIEYIKKANRLHRSSLYLHEMGHALGLGHGTTAKDTMYYIVDTTNELSPADIAGIKALTKVCGTAVPVG